MRSSLAKFALLVSLTGCCPEAHELTVYGELPPDTALVIQVAQEHCDRDLVGEITWVDESRDGVHDGYCSWDTAACPMDAWVVQPHAEHYCFNATCTRLAHEIGHWCLRSEDEDRVEAWAHTVNIDVLWRTGVCHEGGYGC